MHIQPYVIFSWTSPLPSPPSLSLPPLFSCPSSQNEPPQSRQPSIPTFVLDTFATPTANQKNTFY